MLGLTMLPFLVYRLGGDARTAGIVAGCPSVGYVGSCLLSSRFVHHVRNPLIFAWVGSAGFALVIAVLPFLNTAWSLAAVATLSMVFIALFWPATQIALTVNTNPRRRARRISGYNISWSIGMMLGTLLAGILFAQDHRLPYLGVLVAGSAVFVLMLTVPVESVIHRKAPADGNGPPSPEPVDEATTEGHMWTGWIATAAALTMGSACLNVYAEHIKEFATEGALTLLGKGSLALPFAPATQFSLLAFVLSLARVAVFLMMGRSSRWHYRYWFLGVLQILGALAFFFLADTSSFLVIAVCFVFVGLNHGAAFFAGAFYSLAHPLHKHRNAAVNEGMVGIGSFIGSTGFGVVVGAAGMRYGMMIVPAVVALALVLELAMLRRKLGHAARQARLAT